MSLLYKLTIPLFFLDQLTKLLVLNNFVLGDQKTIIPDFFNLVRVHNTGIAFGKFNDGDGSNVIFTVISLLAFLGIIFFWIRGHFPGKLNQFAVALITAGVAGNVTDRILHGYVVDFLDFYIGDSHWPSFNVADSCICIAASLIFISAFTKEGTNPQTEDK
ncbi:MAG: signal peptidase II [Verrucomicrobiales bacterium]|jgi:signal peptidase II|nr:signal peptidase II [Verrucomicrobiales bacterium]MEC7357714.1 signal peptidase II [Verrucomicrobiota bacterium]